MGLSLPAAEHYDVSRGRPTIDDTEIRSAQRDDMLGPLFERVDLLLVLPGRNQPADLRWERLLNASRARCIHCPGRRLRITSPAGTDLEIDVAADAWFHKSDGDLPKERAARAIAVRDRESEHPDGALRFIPNHDSAAGMLVTQISVAGVLTRVRMKIRGGVVISAKADGDDGSFQKLWGSYRGDIDKIAEIVIGSNPLLAGELPSGELPYAGYGAGAETEPSTAWPHFWGGAGRTHEM
jgi:hypothetical protein